MRPLLVLLLVLLAVGAFFVALNTGGDGAETTGIERDGQPAVAGPGQEPVAPTMATPRTEVDTPERPAEAPPRVTVDDGHGIRGNGVRGVVRLPDGRPVAGAEVTLTKFGTFRMFFGDLSEEERASDKHATTDKDGRFEFRDVESYTDYSVIAVHPDHGRREEPSVKVAEGGVIDVLVVLDGGVRLFGLVSDSGGNPVEGAQLRLALTSLGSFPPEDGPNVTVLTTEGGGNFEFINVANGNYTLSVVADGYGRRSIQPINVTGTEDVRQDVTLDVAYMIGGLVVSAEGEPVEGATVQAFSMTNRRESTQSKVETDDAGTFLLDDVSAGTYTLLVRADGYRAERASRVETGDMSVRVELTALPRVRGRVVDGLGQPVSNFTVLLRTPVQNADTTMALKDTTKRFKNARDGEFELACPNHGEYVVEAEAQGFAPCFSEPFSIVYGQELTGVVVQLNQGGTIRGRVVDSSGRGVAGARVKTHDTEYSDDPFWRSLDSFPSQATQAEGRTDDQGDFEISNLAPATYQVDVRHPEFSQHIQRGIVVAEADVRDIGELRLNGGATISGTVLGPSGSGLSGALVQLQSEVLPTEWPVSMSARTDAEGEYVFRHVPAGTYHIYAQRQGQGNVFQGTQDVKNTKRKMVVSEGQSYTQHFSIPN